MKADRAPVVSVIGAGDSTPEQARFAEEIGRLLAEKGAVLVCGGRGGVMEAACRGAHRAGGITIGLLPGGDVTAGNDYLTVAIPTGLGHARNALVATAGASVIAVGGGPGTLSEIGIALKTGRKVITLQSWNAMDFRGRPAGVVEAQSPEEAVELALAKEV
jgi:uncharacterized protein (TIGR00725 family)